MNPSSRKESGPGMRPKQSRPMDNYDSLSVSSRNSNSPRTMSRKFIPDSKYTFYNATTDILQAECFGDLRPQGMRVAEFANEGENIFWLDVNGATIGEWRELVNAFDIHPLTQEDVEVGDSREKVELFDNYIFLCIRTTERVAMTRPRTNTANSPEEEKYLVGVEYAEALSIHASLLPHPITLYVLIFEKFVLSLHWHPIEQVRNVLYRLQKDSRIREPTPDWVAYALLDDIVDEFMGKSAAIQSEADSIDDLVLVLTSVDQHDLLRRIGRARKQTVSLQRQLQPKSDVIRALLDRFKERLQSPTLLYLRDVQDHLLTMLQNLDNHASTLDRSHANYLAQINIELAEASNRMNLTVKKLSGIAAVIVPLSLIASLWGMNVPVPGQPDTVFRDYVAFFTIIFVMSLITTVMYVIARRLHWL